MVLNNNGKLCSFESNDIIRIALSIIEDNKNTWVTCVVHDSVVRLHCHTACFWGRGEQAVSSFRVVSDQNPRQVQEAVALTVWRGIRGLRGIRSVTCEVNSISEHGS